MNKLVNDYYKFYADPYSYVDVKSQWQFQRDNPVGSEVSSGNRRVRLDISELQPIIDLMTSSSNSSFA